MLKYKVRKDVYIYIKKHYMKLKLKSEMRKKKNLKI